MKPEARSRIMRAIRSRDSKPELAVRKAMHRRGFRFRLYRSDLPGKPDLVFPRYRTVVFVHGCFWHSHGCKHFRPPAGTGGYWVEKLRRNRERDSRVTTQLRAAGWKVLTVWECQLRNEKLATRAIDRLEEQLVTRRNESKSRGKLAR